MGFEHDIFISYAHIDNESHIDGKDGWITSFHRALEIRVGQLLGKKPAIWRDPKLHGNDFFEQTLIERLPGVALLVSVLSPRYVNSEWCTRELKEFVEASNKTGGIRVADKSRVFKVVKTPVPPERHPEEVKPFLGYDFFVLDPNTGRPRELDHVLGEDAQRAYWARLDDLAHDIAEILERFVSQHQPATDPADAKKIRGTVFIAGTTHDLREQHDAIRRDLQRHGFDVLPDRPLPLTVDEFQAAVRDDLAKSKISIHLIGRNYGVVPEGAKDSILAIQNELAIERAAANGFSRIVWIPAGLEVEDERQRAFIDHVRTDSRLQDGSDLLETPLEDLKTVIHRRFIEKPDVEPPTPTLPAESDVKQIYVICDQKDVEATADLAAYLFDEGFEVILPAFEGDEAEVREDHEDNLRLCDAVVVYYGDGNDLWLRRKLRELRKATGFGRTKPFAATAILVAPPETPQKSQFRTREAMVIDQIGGFTPEGLKPFVSRLSGE